MVGTIPLSRSARGIVIETVTVVRDADAGEIAFPPAVYDHLRFVSPRIVRFESGSADIAVFVRATLREGTTER
ncbi:MAG: hypothetical protein ABEI99_10860, partial [Halobaculum sp.]